MRNLPVVIGQLALQVVDTIYSQNSLRHESIAFHSVTDTLVKLHLQIGILQSQLQVYL